MSMVLVSTLRGCCLALSRPPLVLECEAEGPGIRDPDSEVRTVLYDIHRPCMITNTPLKPLPSIWTDRMCWAMDSCFHMGNGTDLLEKPF